MNASDITLSDMLIVILIYAIYIYANNNSVLMNAFISTSHFYEPTCMA